MTKQEALGLFQGLNTLGELKGARFAYAVNKNLGLLKPEVEAIEKAGSAYEAKRVALLTEMSDKDESGNPIVKDNQYQVNMVEFSKALTELQKGPEFQEYESLLKETSDFKPFKMKIDDVPQDISVGQLHIIKDLIED